jgi:CRISPR-associated protein Csa3
MQTFVSPIGYDTRRVTRPVLRHGIDSDDEVVVLRPASESDTERAAQAITDVEQYLHEVDPGLTVTVERVPTGDLEPTVTACDDVLRAARGEVVVSLGGGARDVLLPLQIATLCRVDDVDAVLFFSDLDGSVTEWSLPRLTAVVPDRARATLAAVEAADEPVSLSAIADRTGQSKSTVVRHVKALETEGLVESTTDGKAKYVRASFTGRLLGRRPEPPD